MVEKAQKTPTTLFLSHQFISAQSRYKNLQVFFKVKYKNNTMQGCSQREKEIPQGCLGRQNKVFVAKLTSCSKYKDKQYKNRS